MSGDWPIINRRRGILIDKMITGALTVDERIELDALQAFADKYLEIVTPLPPLPRSIEDELAEISGEVSAEEWTALPKDLTDQLDHYLYGDEANGR